MCCCPMKQVQGLHVKDNLIAETDTYEISSLKWKARITWSFPVGSLLSTFTNFE